MTRAAAIGLLGVLLGCTGDPSAAGPARSADGAAAAGPLQSADGPLKVTARHVRKRGADTAGSNTEIRIENNLKADGICEIRISADGNWSGNQLRTANCLPPASATIVLPPQPGEWSLLIKTSGGASQSAVVVVHDLPVGISFED